MINGQRIFVIEENRRVPLVSLSIYSCVSLCTLQFIEQVKSVEYYFNHNLDLRIEVTDVKGVIRCDQGFILCF